jgi:hypothetical protein
MILLFISLYISYKGEDFMTDEYADQLAVSGDILMENSDCHAVIVRDLDFSCNWVHITAL